jgi:hypothetical protein
MSDSAIEVIEQNPCDAVCCPFCGFVCFPGDENAEDWSFDAATCVCDHTLFVATDHGFEYRSREFNRLAGLPDNGKPEADLPDNSAHGYDGYTSALKIPGAIKIASYAPAPSFSGVYYGFAP